MVTIAVVAVVGALGNIALAWLLIKHVRGESDRLATHYAKAMDYLRAGTLQEVADVEAQRANTQVSIQAMQAELVMPSPAEDEMAVTADGRKIPWNHLENVHPRNLDPL